MNLRKFSALLCFFLLLLPLACRAESVLTPYDCWGNLGFEDSPPVNISHWSASGTAITFINDAAQAHTGHGALKIDGTGPISVWGGRVGGSIAPQAGQSVGGFFWIKLLSAPTASSSVDVRMTGYLASVETVYTHTVSINLSTLALNTWVKVDVASAGNTFLAGSDVNFNIVSAGGVNCLIDDITFGSLTTTPDPEPPVVPSVDTAVTPPFDEYVGSLFNGDFEVGNASVGNQYWGQYVPVGGANMMDLITSPAGTAPGAVKSGKNMISISRGGIAWNIADLSSSSTDRLPRVGDLVGGGYWLYVPVNADLNAGVPYVYFIYQSGGGDVTVADTSTFPTSSLVKGAWNFVPIYPKAGATIPASATKAAIMIAAPELNTTANPLYPSPYYIDAIRVGKIPGGVFFASATRLVNGSGATIAAPAVSDTELRVETVLQNSAHATAQSAYVVLKLFQQDVLVSSTVKAVTIAAKGTLGISNTAVALTGSIAGLDQSKLNARLYLYTDSALTASFAPSRTLLQQTRVVPASDPAIRYVGRWSTDGAGKRGNWVRPYFKLTFSRSTSVSINLLQPTSLTVVLDGVTTSYTTVSGLVTLGGNLSLTGTHTLQVSGLVWQDSVFFDGLRLDDIAQLHDTAIKQDHVEFIGDSITAWDNGYSWTVPEQLGVEGSRVAWPGIALRDGFGYYAPLPAGSPPVGMASAYFLNGMPGYGTSGNWSFASASTPNIVVINLGTNDFAAIQFNAPLVAAFQATYQSLIQNVRTRFPAAEIFVLRPFTISAADVQAAIQNATQAVVTAGDTRVHYVDTSAWNVDIIPGDGIHPSSAGHATITSRLVTLLTPYLAGGTRAYAPSITSSNAANFPLGQASTFTISASGSPAPTFQATGLPAWATLHATTGVISGTPSQPGRHTFTVQASNGVGTAATQEFTLTSTASFSQWAASHFPSGQLGNPAIVGATATPQNDGVSNLMKYAFDILPAAPMSSADIAILPKGGMKTLANKTYLTLTYLESPLAPGVTRELQVSEDLATWRTQVPDVIQYLMVDGDRLVEGGVALDGAAKRFLRLRLTAQ